MHTAHHNIMIRAMFDPADIKKFKALLNKATKVVICCHVRPDGDAMGSTLGLCHLLKKLGKKARVVTPDHPPRALSFLPGIDEVVPLSKYPEFAPQLVHDADLILCCDFNKPSRIDSLANYVLAAQCPKVLIDHHQDPDSFCDLTFSYPAMSSASELAFRLICALGWAQEIDLNVATCLATGLITDTRNLAVNCDDPEIYLVLHELLSKGVDKQRIVREALETKSVDAFNLWLHAMSNRMTLLPELHTALIALDTEDLEKFHYVKGDTEGLVNQPLQIKGIKASFFMRKDPDCIKVSARSTEGFPVSKVCEDLFNGGGHLQAAGGEFKGTLQEAVKILTEAMPSYSHYFKQKQS